MNRHKNLIALGAVVAFAVFLYWQGMAFVVALAVVALWQLSQFAMSKRRFACYTTVLTPEQIKEFGTICEELKGLGTLIPGLKDLAGVEGGFAAIKGLPALLKQHGTANDELKKEVSRLKKQAALMQGGHGVRWVNNVPFVTDDCARAITSVMVMECAKIDAMRCLAKDSNRHEGLKQKAAEYLGMEFKTAMTTTEIPVPTIYVPQLIELVFKYGCARQHATVFPMGSGDVRLPRLKAGEDDFGYTGVGTAGMSQSITEKRVAAELVTFTANKAGGLIRIPMELEEDTFIALGQFLARYIARQLAKLEDKTLFIGDGTATYANITGVGPYCAAHTDYLQKLAVGKTSPADVTLDNLRDMRAQVSPAVLANMAASGQTSAKYHLHPSWEPALSKFNKYPNFVVFKNEGGVATLDGWPIHWNGVLQPYTTNAAAEKFCAVFGDLSYWYLGERGTVRVEVSKEVFFATDELAMRALERIDVEAMAVDAVSTLQTGAAA